MKFHRIYFTCYYYNALIIPNPLQVIFQAWATVAAIWLEAYRWPLPDYRPPIRSTCNHRPRWAAVFHITTKPP